MAVQKIKMTSIIGRMTELDQVTEICGESEFFHPDNALSFYSDTSQFTPLSEENPYAEPLQRLVESTAKVKRKLDFVPRKPGKEDQPAPKDEELITYANRFADEMEDYRRGREKSKKTIQELTRSMEDISHFTGLELDLDEIRKCAYIKVRFGSLPKESYEKLDFYNENPYVIFFPSSHDETQYWGVYFAPIDQAAEVDRIFSSLYFKRVKLANYKGSPETALKQMEEERNAEGKRIQEADSRFSAQWKKERSRCCEIYSRLTERSVYFGIRRYAARYNDSFILTGWIPADSEEKFKTSLDPLQSVEYTFENAEDNLNHSPPVRLKNKKLFRPFEYFIDMYGLPSYDEVDPTPFVAITYILLFGIMFADLGQGLVVSLLGHWMWKKKKMKLGRILIPCGICSAVFGTVFGSFFGFEHALDPLYRGMFGLSKKPFEVMEPVTTNLIIYSAIAIGLALVMIAMLINIYSSLRRKHYENALFGPNGAAGLVFYGSLVFGFGGKAAFGWDIVNTPYIICLVVVPLVLIFFREVLGGLMEKRPNWKPESWGEYIMQNFFETFEFLLSYMTNTMSFLRVGAFVLVHAGMMLVVFTLAEMMGGIGYVLAVLIGNVFVMALEGLLVGIQVLRLEFYEMFSRFFEGEGRAFQPVIAREEAQ